MNWVDRIGQACDFVNKGQLRSSFEALRQGYQHCGSRSARAVMAYQLGALYWAELGNGEEARRLFQEAIELCHGVGAPTRRRDESGVPEESLKQVEAYAAENLLLLSLSFDECVRWAEHLRSVTPNEPVLSMAYGRICRLHSHGHPWWLVLADLAHTYHDRTRLDNSGRQGCAASILQLILLHRETLRVPRSGWRTAIGKYGPMLLLQHVQCDRLMQHALGKTDRSETAFIRQAAVEQTEEYLRQYPSDRRLRRFLADLQMSISLDEELRAKSKIGLLPGSWRDLRVGRSMPTAISLLAAGLGCVIGVAWWTDTISWPWNIVGLGVASSLSAIAVVDLVRRRAFRIASHVTEEHAHQTRVVSDNKAVGSTFLTYKTAPDGTTNDLVWQKSARLVRAIHKTGVESCRFRLVELHVTCEWQESPIVLPPGSVVSTFQPEVAVPAEKAHAAGLALRCLVGLTFPYAVTVRTGLKLEVLAKAEYLFGDGVPIGIYRMFRGSDWVGPLQFRGTESDGLWRVFITLASIDVSGSVSDDAVARQLRVLPDVVSAFEPLICKTVVLGKSEEHNRVRHPNQ